MKIDLVFEGGGVLGISFVGAYKALQENDFEIVRCAGTSAGSIISTLIIAGYTPQELETILKETDFKRFLMKTKLTKPFLIGKGLSLMFNKGIYNSECIEIWMDELLSKKGIKTFKDIMRNNESPLKIVAADITNRKMLILPEDLSIYSIEPMDFPISLAVRMSCAIPYFFTPLQFGRNFIVDGGLLSSFPIWIFDLDDKPIRPTFGLKIKDGDSYSSLGKHNIFTYTLDMITASINNDDMSYVRDKDLVRTILIENQDKIKSTDFKLSNDNIEKLFSLGYDSVQAFFKKWSYTDYLKRFML